MSVLKSLNRTQTMQVMRLQHWVMTSRWVQDRRGEQAPGLSGVNVAESKSSLRSTQLKATVRSEESSIMNIASECPVTGTRYDFSKLEDRNRAVSRLCSERPYVLITSPMRTNSFKPASLNLRAYRTENRPHRKRENTLNSSANSS